MGLRFFLGPRAILLPILGLALGAMAVPLAKFPIAIAVLWTAAALLPQDRGNPTALITTLLASGVIRWYAVDNFAGQDRIAAFLAMQTIPRATTIALAWVSRPVEDGAAYEFMAALSTPAALVAIIIGLAAAALCGVRTGIVLVLGAYLIARVVQWLVYRSRGAVNAAALASAQLLTEITTMLLFTCAACTF